MINNIMKVLTLYVQQANQFHHTYATTLNSIEQINTALAELENILIALDRLSNYAELRLSVRY